MAPEGKQLRAFGLLVGGVFGLIGLWPMGWHGEGIRLWAVGVGAALVLPALIRPASLKPIHRIWMALGDVLGWVNTRLILGVVYYGVVTPISLVMRLAGRDPLNRRYEPVARTYRIERQPRPSSHLKQQF